MRQNLSAKELHARYCPVKNTKSALLLVAFFSVAAFENWKGLYKGPEHLDPVRLALAILVLATLAKSLVNFTCFRERLVFVLVIVGFVTGEFYGFFPAIVGPHAHVIGLGKLALSLLGLLVSLTLLVQAVRTPKVEPNELQAALARQLKWNFLIALAVVATALALGSLLYFLPLR